MRRGGMCQRGLRQEVMSIPDTAPGEYQEWADTSSEDV
jgi:hypothetical protein